MFKIKSKLVSLFSKFYNHENIQYELKRDINDFSLKIPNEINNIQADYALGIPSSEDVRYRDDIVFITSRFRSGSSGDGLILHFVGPIQMRHTVVLLTIGRSTMV